MKKHHLGVCALLGAGFFAASLHSTPANAQARVAAPAINNNTGAATDPQATVPPVVYQSVWTSGGLALSRFAAFGAILLFIVACLLIFKEKAASRARSLNLAVAL